MFEPFGAASTPAKIVNILILLFVFLGWVSTMVTFSRPMHHVSVNAFSFSGGLDFYWDHLNVNDGQGNQANIGYNNDGLRDDDNNVGLSGCDSGGKATLAFAVFAFLAFLIHVPLAFCRVAGLNFPLARDTQHSLYIELILTAVEFFCFFLQVCIWGGSCYSPSRSIPGSINTKDGFGLMLAAFFFLLFNLITYFMMRVNENLVLGNGASRGGSSYGGGGGGGDGDYGGGESSQPTFSYQANASESGSTL